MEFWILTTAAEAWSPLAWLSATNRGELYNLPFPEMSEPALEETLWRLVSRKDLVINPNARHGPGEAAGNWLRTGSHPPLDTLIEFLYEDAPIGRFSLYYGLSHQGGSRWEAVAMPQWHRFVDSSSDPSSFGPGLGDLEITSSDQVLVERYLAAWPYISPETPIIPDSEQWEIIQPWQATYWKQLPVGHRVRLRTESVETDYVPRPRWVIEFQRCISDWYRFPSGG